MNKRIGSLAIVLLLMICLVSSGLPTFAEETGIYGYPLSWKGYQLYMTLITENLETYEQDGASKGALLQKRVNSQSIYYVTMGKQENMGLSPLQDHVFIMRITPEEGTISHNDVIETLFVLVEADGTEHPCRFSVNFDYEYLGFIGKTPADRQKFIDLLFEIDGLTAEALAETKIAVYEEEGGEAQLIPLKDIPEISQEV